MEDVPIDDETELKKLTMKALLAKVKDLETRGKSKWNKAANLKDTIQRLMSEPGYENDINKNFGVYQVLINEAKNIHSELLELLPVEEKEKT